MARSTSFRISDATRGRLTKRAERDGLTSTALLQQLIDEGLDSRDHPGIVHRGPAHDRRAALAGGPDLWEIIGRLRELPGAEEERIATVADELELHPRLIRVAIDYAATHPDDVRARLERNAEAAKASRAAAEQRQALLA